MQVSVEATSKVERRITVIVPVEKVEEAFDKQIIKLKNTTTVKGFRPGKVPVEYIKQRYGETARKEALSEVIQSSLYTAMHQEKLTPIGVPTVEPKTVIAGQPLEYVATVEVLPELTAVNFNMDSVEKQVSTITDADIDKVINHLRSQNTTWKKVERAAQDKDQVSLDFRGSIDGKFFQGGEAHDYPIVLGSKTMIPGFEDGVVGLKAGDEKTLSLTFPESYFAKEFAGKTAEFAIKIIKVSEPVTPELDENFVKKLGVKGSKVEDLRAEVRKNLERELARLTKLKLKMQVFAKLMEQNSIEVPKALIEREANRIHAYAHPHHGHDHQHSAAEMQQFTDAAEKNVILGLITGHLMKQHNIKVDKARVQAFITDLASAYEKPEDTIAWYQGDKNRMAEIEMQVLEEQVVEKLLENVKLTEKMVSYDDFTKSVRQTA